MQSYMETCNLVFPENNTIVDTNQHSKGQYFTTDMSLKEKVYEFILNEPIYILEPSVGQGHLVDYVCEKNPHIIFDMYELDETIELLECIDRKKIVYGDFLTQDIQQSYTTIIGNPPFVRTKTGNLYIDFIEKCFHLLSDKGELIFIVPSDVFKLTCASTLLHTMMNQGNFTHIYHPHDEKLFKNASIDTLIFRYCKDNALEKKVLYNDEELFVVNTNGLITFSAKQPTSMHLLKDYFDIHVGLVTGERKSV